MNLVGGEHEQRGTWSATNLVSGEHGRRSWDTTRPMSSGSIAAQQALMEVQNSADDWGGGGGIREETHFDDGIQSSCLAQIFLCMGGAHLSLYMGITGYTN
jgi:hypothetical protein